MIQAQGPDWFRSNPTARIHYDAPFIGDVIEHSVTEDGVVWVRVPWTERGYKDGQPHGVTTEVRRVRLRDAYDHDLTGDPFKDYVNSEREALLGGPSICGYSDEALTPFEHFMAHGCPECRGFAKLACLWMSYEYPPPNTPGVSYKQPEREAGLSYEEAHRKIQRDFDAARKRARSRAETARAPIPTRTLEPPPKHVAPADDCWISWPEYRKGHRDGRDDEAMKRHYGAQRRYIAKVRKRGSEDPAERERFGLREGRDENDKVVTEFRLRKLEDLRPLQDRK